MKEKRAVMLISGYNPRAVVAFCRWATQHKVSFHIIASGKEDPILLTKYADQVEIIRGTKALEADDILHWVKKVFQLYGYDRLVVLPTTEYFNRFLLKNREVLESEGCIIPLVDEALYIEISDKRKFADLCQSHGLDIPHEFKRIPESPPFVAKPKAYFTAAGMPLYPHLIRDITDYESFRNYQDLDDYFFQEFVTGENHYLLACFLKDGPFLLFSQENLIQQSGGKSVILARRSQYHRTENAKKYVDMLKEIGFYGLIMIEVRRTESGEYVMIEANPRLWGPMQFVVDNHIDFFGMLLRDNEFEINDTLEEEIRTEYYYWAGGITEDAQPVVFHHYSEPDFLRNIHDIRKHDIYLREDTLNIYLQELGIVEKAYG